MTPQDVLDEKQAAAIAALCKRAMADAPTEEEIRKCLFPPDQPVVVRGDPDVAVVASTSRDDEGFVRLLAVDPAHRRRGHATSLLAAAESDLSGRRSVTVGADAPYYLFPGVETCQTEMLCLMEHLRYTRAEANFNMGVDLTRLPEDPGGTSLAGPGDRDEVERWMEANWAIWTAEALRALDKSTLVISRDASGLAGFCAYDVNRRGLLGPIATRVDLVGKGAGVPLLVGGLQRMRASGLRSAEVAWVGPIVPYARVGATVSRVFFVHRKPLD